MRLCSSSYCLAVCLPPSGGEARRRRYLVRQTLSNLFTSRQLAEVDPIVASFTGGAVGVVSAFFAIEIRSAQEQEKGVHVLQRERLLDLCRWQQTRINQGD